MIIATDREIRCPGWARGSAGGAGSGPAGDLV